MQLCLKDEPSITTLENARDISKINLAELLNALQAQEQRRVTKQGSTVEGALPVKHQDTRKNKKKKNYRKNQASSSESFAYNQNRSKGKNPKGNCPLVSTVAKKVIHHLNARETDAKCSNCSQLAHEAVICMSNSQRQEADAQVADQDGEDQIFVATCFSTGALQNVG